LTVPNSLTRISVPVDGRFGGLLEIDNILPKSRSLILKKFLFVIALFSMGCQDHHFVPIEKADTKDFPKPPALTKEMTGTGVKKEGATPSFHDTGEKPQKQVMTQEHQSGGVYEKQLIVEGLLSLGGDMAGRDFSNHTLYVLAWNPQKKAPIAVGRFLKVKFPFTFRLDEGDIMAAGGDVLPGLQLAIEARLDLDGDVMTREKGDVYGLSEGLVRIGSSDIRLLLNQIK